MGVFNFKINSWVSSVLWAAYAISVWELNVQHIACHHFIFLVTYLIFGILWNNDNWYSILGVREALNAPCVGRQSAWRIPPGSDNPYCLAQNTWLQLKCPYFDWCTLWRWTWQPRTTWGCRKGKEHQSQSITQCYHFSSSNAWWFWTTACGCFYLKMILIGLIIFVLLLSLIWKFNWCWFICKFGLSLKFVVSHQLVLVTLSLKNV